MADFPTLSYNSTSEVPTLSYTWSLYKVPLFPSLQLEPEFPSLHVQHTFFLISRKNNFARAAHSHCRYIIFMFFFQRNWSPLLFISRSSSFPVIQVNVDWWKERLVFFFSTSPGGHMIYRRNERGAWSAKISPQLQHTPPPTSWLLTSLSLPQSLYGQRSVVRWRHDQIFLSMGLRYREATV